MSSENWVEDVRRWCVSAAASSPAANAADESGEPSTDHSADYELGYEAAIPPVQAAHWPDSAGISMQAPPR